MSPIWKVIAPFVALLAAVITFFSDVMNWLPIMKWLVAWAAGHINWPQSIPIDVQLPMM